MIPIRDHNPSQRTPVVVYALIALNVAIWVWGALAITTEADLARLYYHYALVPALVTEGLGWTGFLTSIFLHGGPLHLAGNMLFLWIFGDNLEDRMGHLRFALFYAACGIAGGVAQVLSEPYSAVPTIGASGAIAGVMGGYLLLFGSFSRRSIKARKLRLSDRVITGCDATEINPQTHARTVAITPARSYN